VNSQQGIAMSSPEAPCYTIVFEDSSEYPSTQDVRSALERGSDEVKIDTLKKILVQAINGNPQVRTSILVRLMAASLTHRVQPALVMPIIQYVLPSRNKTLKKLLHFYWEVCPKYDENGKLKQEMILVV
jgi:coatomer subunit beta